MEKSKELNKYRKVQDFDTVTKRGLENFEVFSSQKEDLMDFTKVDEAIITIKQYCDSSNCMQCPWYRGSVCLLCSGSPGAWKTSDVVSEGID